LRPLSKRESEALALGVLRGLAGLLQAVLLGFLLAIVSREEPGPLEDGTQLGIELDERPGDAEAHGAGLAGDAATVDGDVDVVGLVELRQLERLLEDHPVGRVREEVDPVPTVDDDGGVDIALRGAEADTSHGFLAATGGLHEGLGHELNSYALRR